MAKISSRNQFIFMVIIIVMVSHLLYEVDLHPANILDAINIVSDNIIIIILLQHNAITCVMSPQEFSIIRRRMFFHQLDLWSYLPLSCQHPSFIWYFLKIAFPAFTQFIVVIFNTIHLLLSFHVPHSLF